jgi:hypothetical protein
MVFGGGNGGTTNFALTFGPDEQAAERNSDAANANVAEALYSELHTDHSRGYHLRP